jgi:hypothetical protein
MKKRFLLAGILTASLAASAQQRVKQYFYASGGVWNEPGNKVKVAVIKGSTDQPIDSIKGDFSNTVYIYHDKANLRYEGFAHIGRAGGNDLIVRYDLDTYKVIDSTGTSGAVAFARNREKLVVAKGYGATGAMVDILNASDLSFVKGVTGIDNLCTDVKIWGDTAFVSHSLPTKKAGWIDSVGYLSLISISRGELIRTVRLGEKAKGLKNLIISKEPDQKLHIYFSNFGDHFLETYDNMIVHGLKGSQTVAVTNHFIFGIQQTQPQLTAIDINKFTDDTLTHHTDKAANFVECAYDTVNNLYLILKGQYGVFGKLIRYSVKQGKTIDSVNVGLATIAIQVDYRPDFTTAISYEGLNQTASVFPNPCKDVLNIRSNANRYTIRNLQGIELASGGLELGETSIDIEHFGKGVYTIALNNGDQQRFVKFVKE